MAYQPTIILVDDHDLVRSGVRAELGSGVRVLGEAGDVQEAVDIIVEKGPDVVVLDVHLPSGTGADVVKAVLEKGISTKFLALSVSDDPSDVISVIRAGARGYVTKAISGEELLAAIVRVVEGDAVFSPKLAGFVIDAFAKSPKESSDPLADQLSPRESEVMKLLARGYAYKEVARRLNISVKTVETHASNVLRKLQLSSRHELQNWAAKRRMI